MFSLVRRSTERFTARDAVRHKSSWYGMQRRDMVPGRRGDRWSGTDIRTRWTNRQVDRQTDRWTTRRASEASRAVLVVWRSHFVRSFGPSPALTGHSSLRLTRYHSHHFNGLRRSALCHGSPSGEENRKHRVSPPGRMGGDSGEIDQFRSRFLECGRYPWAVQPDTIGSYVWHVGVAPFKRAHMTLPHLLSPLLAGETYERTTCVATLRFTAGRRTALVEQGETSMFTRLYSCQPDGEGLK